MDKSQFSYVSHIVKEGGAARGSCLTFSPMLNSAPMRLSEFLRASSKEERAELAGRLDTSTGYLYLLAGGHRRMRPEFAIRLHRATEGRCSFEDNLPELAADLRDVLSAPAIHEGEIDVD